MKEKDHTLIVKLGRTEQTCILIRDKLFDGSWEKFLKHINEKGSDEQKKEIPMVKRLMDLEKKYDINLNKEE